MDPISKWSISIKDYATFNAKRNYEDKGEVTVIAITNYTDVVEQRDIKVGELFQVSEERAEILLGNNYLNRKFVELME